MEETKKENPNLDALKDLESCGPYLELGEHKLHPLAHKEGGLYMHDYDGKLIGAAKDMIKKMAAKAATG